MGEGWKNSVLAQGWRTERRWGSEGRGTRSQNLRKVCPYEVKGHLMKGNKSHWGKTGKNWGATTEMQ